MSIAIRCGDCREVLPSLPDCSVHCVVTSPPYWGLRDYGVDGQLGLEPDFNAYVANMVAVFREVRRVLRDDGTLWLNLGDSYANGRSAADTKTLGNDDRTFRDKPISTVGGVLKPKDICGIPWRVAFALQADGWYLRQDIIWSKPNPMPESVTDRCTKAHEYLFLLSKRERYYYDSAAIAETAVADNREFFRGNDKYTSGNSFQNDADKQPQGRGHVNGNGTRNKRSVWEVTTQPFAEAHFATFPPALIEPCIKAGTSEKGCCGKCGRPWARMIDVESRPNKPPALDAKYNGNGMHRGMSVGREDRRERIDQGWLPSCACVAEIVPCTVLDPFGGAGTTGLVADRLQRNAILIELNLAYAAMSQGRITDDAPLFAEIAP